MFANYVKFKASFASSPCDTHTITEVDARYKDVFNESRLQDEQQLRWMDEQLPSLDFVEAYHQQDLRNTELQDQNLRGIQDLQC